MTVDLSGGTAAFALGAAVATFFSPCAYALLPGYVGYYISATDGEVAPLDGALVRGVAATVGVFATFGALSGAAIVAGEAVEGVLPVVEPLVGVALVVLGLSVLRSGSLSVHVLLPERRATVLGFGLFGAMYALAATACVLPLFLALVVRSLSMSPPETALVLGTYASGFGLLMLAVTVATAVGHGLGAGRVAGYADRIARLAGLVLVVAGLGQVYVALAFTY